MVSSRSLTVVRRRFPEAPSAASAQNAKFGSMNCAKCNPGSSGQSPIGPCTALNGSVVGAAKVRVLPVVAGTNPSFEMDAGSFVPGGNKTCFPRGGAVLGCLTMISSSSSSSDSSGPSTASAGAGGRRPACFGAGPVFRAFFDFLLDVRVLSLLAVEFLRFIAGIPNLVRRPHRTALN